MLTLVQPSSERRPQLLMFAWCEVFVFLVCWVELPLFQSQVNWILSELQWRWTGLPPRVLSCSLPFACWEWLQTPVNNELSWNSPSTFWQMFSFHFHHPLLLRYLAAVFVQSLTIMLLLFVFFFGARNERTCEKVTVNQECTSKMSSAAERATGVQL